MVEFKVGTKAFTETPKPRKFGHRHTLTVMGFTGFALSYALRFNLSIAIVAMVNVTSKPLQDMDQILFKADICPYIIEDQFSHTQEVTNITEQWSSATSTQITITEEDHQHQGEFNWSESEQGLILGSFFWGYYYLFNQNFIVYTSLGYYVLMNIGVN